MNLQLLKLFLISQKLDPGVVEAITASAATLLDGVEALRHGSWARSLSDLTAAAKNLEQLAATREAAGDTQTAADLRLYAVKILAEVADMLADDEEESEGGGEPMKQ